MPQFDLHCRALEKDHDMKNAPLLIITAVAIALFLSVAGACGGGGTPTAPPQTAERPEVVVADTARPTIPTPPSQTRAAATHTPIPTLTPAPPATPASQSRSGLGVTRYSVQSGLEEVGFSFVSYASVGTVYGDSADGTATVKIFAPDDTLREAAIQFYYTPALKPESVVLNSLIFTGFVLPDWSSGGDWLADAFERAANGESVETSVNIANGKADVVLEIVGGDTISLAITSAGSNNYALEIAGVTPTPVSTRPSGVMRLVPKSVDIPKEASTPVVIATQNPTSAGGTLSDPCGILGISEDMSFEEKKKRIDCTRTLGVSDSPSPTPVSQVNDPCGLTKVTSETSQEELKKIINCTWEQAPPGLDALTPAEYAVQSTLTLWKGSYKS